MQVDLIEVVLWGQTLGALAWDKDRQLGEFNYADTFSDLEVAPFLAPLGNAVFQGNRSEAFAGLPEFIADALPDKFGNTIISAYFERKGLPPLSMTPLDKLAYIGERAMGALVFKPLIDHADAIEFESIELSQLVDAARKAIKGNLAGDDESTEKALNKLLSVGISAGGARAKAVINYCPDTGEMTSGQFPAKPGYEPWLLKFDGMGKDDALGESQLYGRIEYAYYLMAIDAGITMSECQLLTENGRAHFMTRRFDRLAGVDTDNYQDRLHMQTYCGLKGLDYNFNHAHSYEDYFRTVLSLLGDKQAVEQAYLRCCFNVIARNQDDHTKNLSFLMDREGNWSLSPAYDVTYAYNPDNYWTANHQMSVNGKFTGIDKHDLLAAGADYLSKVSCERVLDKVTEVVRQWPVFAEKAGLPEETVAQIKKNHELL